MKSNLALLMFSVDRKWHLWPTSGYLHIVEDHNYTNIVTNLLYHVTVQRT